MRSTLYVFAVSALIGSAQAQTFSPLSDQGLGDASVPAVAPADPGSPIPADADSAPAKPVAQPVPKPSAPTPAPQAQGRGKSPAQSKPAELPPYMEPNGKIERVIFARRPIQVALATGRERIVYLPWSAQITVPPEAESMTVQVIGQTVFLRSDSPIAHVRLTAQGMGGEGFIPLDITVRPGAEIPDELEVFLKPDRDTSPTASKDKSGEDDDDTTPEAPDMVQMTRFCLQQIYAPLRLVKPLPGIRQVEIKTAPVAGLYRGDAVMSTPIGAWRSTDQYVTAIRLTNRTSFPVDLDMERLRGHWLAATPQHWHLQARGSEADTTVVCLISDQAFDEAR